MHWMYFVVRSLVCSYSSICLSWWPDNQSSSSIGGPLPYRIALIRSTPVQELPRLSHFQASSRLSYIASTQFRHDIQHPQRYPVCSELNSSCRGSQDICRGLRRHLLSPFELTYMLHFSNRNSQLCRGKWMRSQYFGIISFLTRHREK